MLRNIQGVRLQPIVRLNSGEVIGHEILSLLPSGTDVDFFFKKLPAKSFLTLLEKQLNTVRDISDYGLLFANLPIRALTDSDLAWKDFYSCFDNDVIIEIQDSNQLRGISVDDAALIEDKIVQLHRRGGQVWLDDYTFDMSVWLTSAGIGFDGVKTDYHELHKCRSEGALIKPLIDRARKLSDVVLIEGIETDNDFQHACASGADLGQGFFWPQLIIS